MIRKLPLPIAGLILGLAAGGNLILSYGSIYRNILGIVSGIFIMLLLIKIFAMPKSLKEGFDNPVVASVMPTFSMALMLLSTYFKPYFSSGAFLLWLIALALHIVLMILFTVKYIINFNIKKVFPSYFVVYVGIVCASVTAPAFGMTQLGQYIFWFGLAAYLILLPIAAYRVLAINEIPEPAMPTLTIFTAPASLCLTGYLNTFQNKNLYIVGFLAVLLLLMFIGTIVNMPRLLRLKFYPSYSAFTFPFVITAIAMKGTNTYLLKTGTVIPFMDYFVNMLELWAIAMVLYVLVRYVIYLSEGTKTAGVTADAKD
ncbi:MAG: TDT family transporter [Bacillota bacterium]